MSDHYAGRRRSDSRHSEAGSEAKLSALADLEAHIVQLQLMMRELNTEREQSDKSLELAQAQIRALESEGAREEGELRARIGELESESARTMGELRASEERCAQAEREREAARQAVSKLEAGRDRALSERDRALEDADALRRQVEELSARCEELEATARSQAAELEEAAARERAQREPRLGAEDGPVGSAGAADGEEGAGAIGYLRDGSDRAEEGILVAQLKEHISFLQAQLHTQPYPGSGGLAYSPSAGLATPPSRGHASSRSDGGGEAPRSDGGDALSERRLSGSSSAHAPQERGPQWEQQQQQQQQPEETLSPSLRKYPSVAETKGEQLVRMHQLNEQALADKVHRGKRATGRGRDEGGQHGHARTPWACVPCAPLRRGAAIAALRSVCRTGRLTVCQRAAVTGSGTPHSTN
jgi:hypothetical protein